MSLRFSFAAAAAALFVAACGSEAPEPAETETAATESPEQLPDIFAEYVPWDGTADGVQTTESGLQYVVLRAAEGDAEGPASPRDRVTVMYDGRIASSGQKFDSSYDRGSPATFGLNQVISGWTEGLQLMKEGEEFLFFIPSELGYGQNPRPGGVIQPGDDLLFRVELQSVQLAPEPKVSNSEAWAAYTPWNSDNPDIVAAEDGVEYVVLDAGRDNPETPEPADTVVVYYEGRLAETGDKFDSAYDRGQPALFPAGGLIPGFTQALLTMRRGESRLVYIPAAEAYGPGGTPDGTIPPNADLIFEIELQDILKAG